MIHGTQFLAPLILIKLAIEEAVPNLLRWILLPLAFCAMFQASRLQRMFLALQERPLRQTFCRTRL